MSIVRVSYRSIVASQHLTSDIEDVDFLTFLVLCLLGFNSPLLGHVGLILGHLGRVLGSKVVPNGADLASK